MDGMECEDVPGGIRVTLETSAPKRLARFVVGLGGVAKPLTPDARAGGDCARGGSARGGSGEDGRGGGLNGAVAASDGRYPPEHVRLQPLADKDRP